MTRTGLEETELCLDRTQVLGTQTPKTVDLAVEAQAMEIRATVTLDPDLAILGVDLAPEILARGRGIVAVAQAQVAQEKTVRVPETRTQEVAAAARAMVTPGLAQVQVVQEPVTPEMVLVRALGPDLEAQERVTLGLVQETEN